MITASMYLRHDPKLTAAACIWLWGLATSTVPASPESPYEPIAEGYDLSFELVSDEERRLPAVMRQVPLQPASAPAIEGEEPLEARLRLGPEPGDGRRVVVARRSRGKPYSLLWIDRDGDGSLDDEEPVRSRPRRSRERIRSEFETAVRVLHPADGTQWREYPMLLWLSAESRQETPSGLYYRQRGAAIAEIDLNGFLYEVVLVDRDQDAVFDGDDWWSLRPALAAGGQARPVEDLALARGFAWQLELLGAAGAEGRLLRYEASDERVREARRDPRQSDRMAPRAVLPVPFTNQVETTIAAAEERGLPYFLDFTADWCAPCRQMDDLVYTAEAVAEAAREVVCIKVENDEKLRRRHRVTSYPTGILFQPDGTEIDRFRGYRSVKSMVAFFRQARPFLTTKHESEVEE